MEPPDDDLVLVGMIARPHGLRGQVIVDPATDFPETRFAERVEVLAMVGGRLQTLRVASLRFHQRRPIVAFEGYGRIEDVEPLVGQSLWVRGSERLPLPEGSFYHTDLVGCRVETVAGELIGTVMRIDETGAAPLLVVERDRGEVLIPMAEAICRTIDTTARRIVIEPPEGLLELNRH